MKVTLPDQQNVSTMAAVNKAVAAVAFLLAAGPFSRPYCHYVQSLSLQPQQQQQKQQQQQRMPSTRIQNHNPHSTANNNNRDRGLAVIPDRRAMLQTVVSTACTTAALVISFPPSCRADEGYQNKNTAPSAVTTPLAAEAEADAVVTPTITKPYAPVETLIPATRVKRLIDRSVALATELVEEESGEADIDRQRQRRPPAVIVEELQSLLLFEPQNFTACINTPSFVPAVPRQPAKQYLDAYDRNRETLNVIAKPGAMLVQNGEIAAWKQLKQQEVLKEQQDDIRAALNLYTSSLTFSGTAYVLTVPKPVRSKMVREDRLPDVTQVIQSDMGMRYLHRNEILTAMEDARAELRYQLSLQQQQQQQPQQKEAFLDGADLLEILKRAQRAATQLFALIDEGDVQAAVAAVELQECSTSPVALPSS